MATRGGEGYLFLRLFFLFVVFLLSPQQLTPAVSFVKVIFFVDLLCL